MLRLSVAKFPIRLAVSAVLSVTFALLLLMLFSVVAYFTGYNNLVLKIINILIRFLATAFCIILLTGESGAIKNGIIGGLVSSVAVQATFSCISGRLNWGDFALNTVFCIIFGVIFAIIYVNLKNNGKSS